jgi:hypothetical protein
MPQGSAPDGALTVLYIGGYGRSGSTVLDRVLGALPDAVSVGEIRSIWGAVLREDRLCACGQRFSAVLLDRGGRAGVRRLGPPAVERAGGARHVDRTASGPGCRARGRLRSIEVRLRSRRRSGISGGRGDRRRPCGGCQQYVRGDPAQGPGVDLRAAGTIETPGAPPTHGRGRVVKPDAGGDGTFMPTYRASRASAEWLFYNAGFDALKAMRPPCACTTSRSSGPSVGREGGVVRRPDGRRGPVLHPRSDGRLGGPNTRSAGTLCVRDRMCSPCVPTRRGGSGWPRPAPDGHGATSPSRCAMATWDHGR